MAKAISKTPYFLSCFTSRQKKSTQESRTCPLTWDEEAYKPKITVLLFIAKSTYPYSAWVDYYSANTLSPPYFCAVPFPIP